MLKEKFKDFGNVVEAFVVKNKYTGDTKGSFSHPLFGYICLLRAGYGFVHFSSMDEVYAVLDAKELPRFEDSVNHKMYVHACCSLRACCVICCYCAVMYLATLSGISV